MSVFICVKAHQNPGLQEAGVFKPWGSHHSLVCVVCVGAGQDSRAKAKYKAYWVFDEILPTYLNHLHAFGNNRLSDLQAQEWGQNGLLRAGSLPKEIWERS